MKKFKNLGTNAKLFILFFVLLGLSIISFFVFDFQNVMAESYKYIDDDGFYINLKNNNGKIRIKDGEFSINTSKGSSVGESKRIEKDYDLTGIENISLSATQIDIEVIKSEKNSMKIEMAKDRFNEKISGKTIDISKKNGMEIGGVSDYMEVEIYTNNPDILNLDLSGTNIDLSNNMDLKSLDISGTEIDVESSSEKSFNIEIDGTNVEAEINVKSNNFDININAVQFDFESSQGSSDGMGEMNRKFGTGENKLIINGVNVDLEMN